MLIWFNHQIKLKYLPKIKSAEKGNREANFKFSLVQSSTIASVLKFNNKRKRKNEIVTKTLILVHLYLNNIFSGSTTVYLFSLSINALQT